MSVAVRPSGYKINGGVANWKIEKGVTLEEASIVKATALKLCRDPKVRSIHFELSDQGVTLPIFQIIVASCNCLKDQGKTFEVSGQLRPSAGESVW